MTKVQSISFSLEAPGCQRLSPWRLPAIGSPVAQVGGEWKVGCGKWEMGNGIWDMETG